MRTWWLLGLLAACETSPETCQPCDFTPGSCPSGEACIGDPELGTGTCSSSDEAACEVPLDTGDGKGDASSLPHQRIERHAGQVMQHVKLWTLAWPVDAQLARDIDVF